MVVVIVLVLILVLAASSKAGVFLKPSRLGGGGEV